MNRLRFASLFVVLFALAPFAPPAGSFETLRLVAAVAWRDAGEQALQPQPCRPDASAPARAIGHAAARQPPVAAPRIERWRFQRPPPPRLLSL